MQKSLPVALCILSVSLLGSAPARQAVEPTKSIELLNTAERVVFLGDSITHHGQYVAMFDAWLQTQRFDETPIVINVGLPSETVSGLSEEGHAGGRFPRPDLAERLDRVLDTTRPDLVFACYGINCGIYQPLDERRFRAYREGMEHLRQKVEAAGATLVQITPPCYDDLRGPKDFSYNAVLDRYSDYLLKGREQGRRVVDLHHAMTAELAKRRESDPDFAFQRDAVHPDFAGHWFMAGRLIRWFGDAQAAGAESPQAMLEARGIPGRAYDLIAKRMAVRRNAYLSAAGHTRPGVQAGLPIKEAEEQARRLTEMIRELSARAEEVRAKKDKRPDRTRTGPTQPRSLGWQASCTGTAPGTDVGFPPVCESLQSKVGRSSGIFFEHSVVDRGVSAAAVASHP